MLFRCSLFVYLRVVRNDDFSLCLQIFGSDLKYSMYNSDREIREALTRINPWQKLNEIASGKEIRYENAIMFLDSIYVAPMTSGLPVRLDFAGSAACNFKMSGLLDTKRISEKEIELISNIAPRYNKMSLSSSSSFYFSCCFFFSSAL